ncbi:hypothetical protein LCGC14_0787580 [marine sediment metagenome]|uniref:Uncharacterized protein n=1 Tax=marine sediment metagenome TaxID=412755 RepID=A0A0F9QDE6_9ZZZZ
MSQEFIEQTRKHNEKVEQLRHRSRSPLEYFEVRLAIVIAVIALAVLLVS